VVGDGGNKKELEEYACQLGLGQRIVFTGFRGDVPELLSEVAISVLPSLSEGTSNTLLESMAAGVPVIATRVGGNPEVIEDGVSGLLVPPRDSAALAAAMDRLLEDEILALALGQAGMRRVSELFSLEGSVHETEHLYQRLVDAKAQV
jgi:glycosyltransferase involved in cell wall biosynthesis